MNPFTRFLNQWSGRQNLSDLIEHWDQLEQLAIAVYKRGAADEEALGSYALLKSWLDQHYVDWEAALAPFWADSPVGGSLDHQDPFRYLFQYESAEAFVGNWAALQHLPAAREALNRYLQENQG